MKHTEWNEVKSIFQSRGVTRRVASARPYKPYRRGDKWVYADDGPYAVIPPAQRAATVTRDVRGADGLVMFKHPVPLAKRKLSEYPPQLRPTADPETGSIVNHDHTDSWTLSSLGRMSSQTFEHIQRDHGGEDVAGLHDNYRPEVHLHSDFTPGARADHVAGKSHHGVDTDEPHPDGEPGKYKLPPSPLRTVYSPHEHPRPVWSVYVDRRLVKHTVLNCRHKPVCETDEEHTLKHLAKYKHETTPEDGVLHLHPHRQTDETVPSYGKRLDIHPLAIPLLESARAEHGRVFISMEGNLKADSLLTAGEAVVSIPAVGQWRCAELDDFADEWLRGVMVFLVPDSDWADPSKYDVQRQAFAFREYLRRILGKGAVYVASPPEPVERDEWGEPVKVGVDDWLALRKYGGYGGTVDGLVVVDRETSPALRRWCEDYTGVGAPRSQRAGKEDLRKLKSEARVLELMALVSKADGQGRASVKSLSAFTTMKRETVSRALDALAEFSNPETSPLEVLDRRPPSMGYRNREQAKLMGGLEHQDTVEWTIREGYRWQEKPVRTVGDLG